MTLIVVHRDDQVEVSALRPKEERVRRKGTFDTPTSGAAGSDGRFDLLGFFSAPEEDVLA